MSFVLLAALNREARKRGLFSGGEPDIRAWLDLAAMGAVCDVTQLTGFNRALTAQGLKVMSAWANPGLKALMDIAKGQGAASVFHVGFLLGPRINAGGRIGRSDLGARLLSTEDSEEAAALAAELDGLNASRKEVEKEVQEAAVRHIERESNQAEAPCLVVAEDGWHPGVIGIVAGRLRERYRKPVIVIGIDRAADVGKGSGRSQPGVNLGARSRRPMRRACCSPGAAMPWPPACRCGPTPFRSFAPFSASEWPPRPRSQRPGMGWRSMRSSPRAGRTVGSGPTSSGWRRSAPAIPNRCSRRQTSGWNDQWPCAAATSDAP